MHYRLLSLTQQQSNSLLVSSPMQRRLVLVVMTLMTVWGCGRNDTVTQGGESEMQWNFTGSSRRSPNSQERSYIANMSGCTAFFVANNQGKAYVMSARHCINGANPASYCANLSVNAESGGQMRCSRVIAWDNSHDPFLFEVSGSKPAGALKLAAFVPSAGSKLKMVGYPADREMNGRITVTESCQVGRVNLSSPYSGSAQYSWMRDQTYSHNCTTYGGNSGGPMLLAGTDIAIGEPYTYEPSFRAQSSSLYAAHGAQMAFFVSTFSSQLNTAGVVIARNASDAGTGDNPVVNPVDPVSGSEWWKPYFTTKIGGCSQFKIKNLSGDPSVNLRAEPSKQSAAVGKINDGAIISIDGGVKGPDQSNVTDAELGKSSSVWLHVTSPQQGWVSQLYVGCG